MSIPHRDDGKDIGALRQEATQKVWHSVCQVTPWSLACLQASLNPALRSADPARAEFSARMHLTVILTDAYQNLPPSIAG
jgi:hypothetical protein